MREGNGDETWRGKVGGGRERERGEGRTTATTTRKGRDIYKVKGKEERKRR